MKKGRRELRVEAGRPGWAREMVPCLAWAKTVK